MSELNTTPFSTIYDSFLSRVTSDMYADLEFSEIDTLRELQDILINAIPRFKLPRFDIFDYELGDFEYMGMYTGVESGGKPAPATGWIGGFFNSVLSLEEINILSLAMVVEWLGQQLATTDNTRMKYSGPDYKFTSQANHMAKIKVLLDKYESECKSLQDTYKRRKRVDGEIRSTLGLVMTTPSYGYKID